MARPVWSGAIQFGMVTIPVKLTTAVREHTVRFNQINKNTGNRVSIKRVDAETEDAVAFEDIVKGYEVSKDKYVIVDPEELEKLAPISSKILEVDDFVPAESIDPVVYDTTYYLSPDDIGEKAYQTLYEALSRSGKVAIGTTVMRQRSHPIAIRAEGGVLQLSTLHWTDEIVPPEPVDVPVADNEVKMAMAIIEAMSSDALDMSKYEDFFTVRVKELVEAKMSGSTAPTYEERDVPPATDLLSALAASLDKVRDAATSPA